MAVAGVFVHAEIGDKDHRIAEAFTALCERYLNNALWVPRARTLFVFRGGHAEEDDSGDAELAEVFDLVEGGFECVLHHAWKRRDGFGFVDSFTDKQRCDQVARRQRRLGDELSERLGPAKTAKTTLRESHSWNTTAMEINAITLAVVDMAAALRFHADTLGLPVAYGGADSEFTTLELDSTFLNLFVLSLIHI